MTDTYTKNNVLFQITDLTVSTGSKTLVKVGSLTIYKHCLTAFIGPNGAGKSTLLHSLLNKQGSTGLKISGDINSTTNSSSLSISYGEVAWVGQHERFELPLTTLDYALLGVSPKLAWYQKPNQNHIVKAYQLIEDFELSHLVHERVQTLSGGEKQRLAIVRALMQETDILMLDEPTNHLDIRHQRFLLHYLQRLVDEKNKTIIVVLHDLTHAYRYSDDVIVMHQGEVAAQGRPNEVMTQEILSPIYQVDIEPYDTEGGRVFV